jgi:GrpB-like predicted nucleotidyltransferase (UPF0157 family)/predicted kinase
VPAPILVVAGPSGAGKTTVGRLVAAALGLSAHVRSDDFTAFVVNGWIDPNLPGARHQNDVVGGAVAAAVVAFAEGGYTVVLDGHWFPDALEGLAQVCGSRGVPLHYAVLRADLGTCLTRVRQRRPGDPDDIEAFARLHSRFTDLGDQEASVIEASGAPEQVAEALLAAFTAGRLVEVELIGGAEQRDIELVAHDPEWARRFEAERDRIVGALGADVRVEHIGSTAVPGLVAKPIVDIQVSVAEVGDEASYVPALIAAGYELRVRERGHRMLRTPERDVHVHVCRADSDWERRHLGFRDRLRTSAADCDRYAAVKRSLATRRWSSMNAYATAKSEVIAEIMNRPPE